MPKDDEIDQALSQDLTQYLERVKAVSNEGKAVLLATQLWTVEQKLDAVRCQLDELLRRTPPSEHRAAPFN